MLYKLWSKVRPLKSRASTVVLIGLFLIVSACRPNFWKSEPSPQDLKFFFIPLGPIFLPGDEIGVGVKVGFAAGGYYWYLKEGNGIIKGNNRAPIITYRAPETPGAYKVYVVISYEDGNIPGETTVVVSDQVSVLAVTLTPATMEAPTTAALIPSTFTPTTVKPPPTDELPPTKVPTAMVTLTRPSSTPTTAVPPPTGELLPTKVPTAMVTLIPPTSTPTTAVPSPTYELPTTDTRPVVNLVSPPDNTNFSGENQKIELQWRADKALPKGTHYFIDARFTGIDENGVCRENWLYFKWTTENSFIVDPWLYDAMCPAPDKRIIQWTVYVGQLTNSLDKPDGVRLGGVADRWTFEWTIQGGDGSKNDASGGGGSIDMDPGGPID
jgi:hypothetical protein